MSKKVVHCPQCGSRKIKLNGHIHNGKQNHRCKRCGRQFVLEPSQRLVSISERELTKRLLAERLSLHGIRRAVGVSMRWLMGFAVECYDASPKDLNVRVPQEADDVVLRCLDVEADELQSFVARKTDKQWLWLAMEPRTRQAIAFYVGDRSKGSARKLWERIPSVYRDNATFFTDAYASYKGVIPEGQHRVISKASRLTNHVERLNCTLRQRISRLVRSTLSFSKKLENHVGAIRYFLCQYNLELARP